MTDAPRRTTAVVGLDGPAVVISARACAWLDKYADLRQLRTRYAALVDDEITQTLLHMGVLAADWHNRHGASPANGTAVADTTRQPPPLELTTQQAADLIGISPSGIRKAINRGQLDATRSNGRWTISRADAEMYRTRPPARPGGS
ncbi:helix-turn-helix domain-containing protein [Nonomuraea candida]|uniref:helix-turn-helix domain-containing protein n=1 Tax=Nonomuraea candida TaxID=359159 RepID=UPI0005B766CF|nr:helix-turn-helix domain-containing protein [Nonomuraea candida]